LVSGTTGAAPIWNKMMTALLKDKNVKKPTMPSGVVGVHVCNLTGLAVPESGCESHYEYFKKEFLPAASYALRQNILINKDTGKIVTEGENIPNAEWQEHSVVMDVTGTTICLDCPVIEGAENKPVIIR